MRFAAVVSVLLSLHTGTEGIAAGAALTKELKLTTINRNQDTSKSAQNVVYFFTLHSQTLAHTAQKSAGIGHLGKKQAARYVAPPFSTRPP